MCRSHIEQLLRLILQIQRVRIRQRDSIRHPNARIRRLPPVDPDRFEGTVRLEMLIGKFDKLNKTDIIQQAK